MPGAGKSTVAGMIARNFSARVFETGDVIREEIRRRGLRYTKGNDARISEWFHAGREKLIIGRTARKMRACSGKILVVTGFFAPKEYNMLKRAGEAVLIAVSAPSAVRYKREIMRNRFSGQTEKYLRGRDRRELREGLGDLLKRADYRISSGATKKELEKSTVALVRKILEEKSGKPRKASNLNI